MDFYDGFTRGYDPIHVPPHGLGIIAQRQMWPAVQQHREAQRVATLHLHVQVPNQGLTWLPSEANRWGMVSQGTKNWWKGGGKFYQKSWNMDFKLGDLLWKDRKFESSILIGI